MSVQVDVHTGGGKERRLQEWRWESPVSLHPQESPHPVYGARVQSTVNQGKSQVEEAIVLIAGGDNEGRDDPA